MLYLPPTALQFLFTLASPACSICSPHPSVSALSSPSFPSFLSLCSSLSSFPSALQGPLVSKYSGISNWNYVIHDFFFSHTNA